MPESGDLTEKFDFFFKKNINPRIIAQFLCITQKRPIIVKEAYSQVCVGRIAAITVRNNVCPIDSPMRSIAWPLLYPKACGKAWTYSVHCWKRFLQQP